MADTDVGELETATTFGPALPVVDPSRRSQYVFIELGPAGDIGRRYDVMVDPVRGAGTLVFQHVCLPPG